MRWITFGLALWIFQVNLAGQAVLELLADTSELPQAIVIGNRSQVPLQSVGHTFDIISRSELMKLPISSVAEALQFIPGLELRQRGPRGVQADLSIRGGTFDQVLVLINGIKLADPQTGHHVLNIPVPLENVERIEVLKGPGARLYGQNAFAGAINIVTRTGVDDGLSLRAGGGENGLASFGASANLRNNGIAHTLSYARDLSAGYRYNTDFDIANLLYQAEMPTRNGNFSLLAAISERSFGANGFYSSASAKDQAEEVQTSVLGLSHRYHGEKVNFSQRLSWRRNQDEYVFLRRNPSVYRNLHISHSYGYDGYLDRRSRFGKSGLGLEIQGIALRSNNLGDHQRLNASLLLEHAFSFYDDKLIITPGLTLNHLSDAGTRVLPALDLLYRVSDELKFYGNAGTTYRVPTYTDLYYSDRFNRGNANLIPERAYAFELGSQYALGVWQVSGAVWQRTALDQIDYQRPVGDSVWYATNLQEVNFQGFEASVAARSLRAWLPLISLSYNFIDAEKKSIEDRDSRYVLEQVRHQFIAKSVFQLSPKLSTTLAFRFADRVSETSNPDYPLDYALLDARIDYRFERLSLYVEATNLSDEKYSQSSGVPLPGRWASAGLELRL